MLWQYALVSGILFGLFYGFLGIGLNLLFGVMRLVNLAHGDIIVLGGYLAYELSSKAHINPLWAIPLAVPIGLAFGAVLYRLVVPRLSRAEDSETASLVLFFGVSQAIEAIATLAFGNNQAALSPTTFGGPIHILGQGYPAPTVISGLLSIPVLALLFAYLYRTRLGLATRAVMADEQEALASGISVRRVSAAAFAIGIAFAAAAGPLALFMLGGVSPSGGVNVTIAAFTVIIIGSLGNPLGTAVGGILYGLAFTFTTAYASTWAQIVPFLLLLVVVLAKPSGLLGRSVRSA